MPREEIERQAKLLASDNREAEPQILKIYWFPDDEEVRLIEVLPTIPIGDGQVHPFFFRASPTDDLPAPSGIALIRPDEVRRAHLPPDWGDWDDAVELEIEA
jgi:hypothetical protein